MKGQRCSFLLCVLLFVDILTSTVTAAAASVGAQGSSSSSNHLPVLYKDDDDDSLNIGLDRALYVRGVLIQRLEHVSSGARMKDIVHWIQKHSHGEATIFSMHGAENTNVDLKILEEIHESEASTANEIISTKDPFSKNRMHLGLVSPPDAPPPRFPGRPLHVIDDTRPNALQLFFRAMRLGINFTPVMSTFGLAFVSSRFRRGIWYKWLASCIGNSGAAWIKWGQWSSTRNDMFPEALCRELSMLHADAPAHGFQFSRQQLESSLGLAPNTMDYVFDSFEQTPLASGSIAQVHRAEINGNLLAVKIRHPKVALLIDMDFRLMTMVARIFDVLPGLRWLRIRDSVEQFSSTMAAQAHLHVEAYHLEILNYNFRNWKSTRFPEPFFASSSVIIETFEPGVVLTKYLEEFEKRAQIINRANGVDPSGLKVEEPDDDSGDASASSQPRKALRGYDIFPFPIAKFLLAAGLDLYLKMLLVDNLMHADLHPVSVCSHPSTCCQLLVLSAYYMHILTKSCVCPQGNIILNLDHQKGLATMESARKVLATIDNVDLKPGADMTVTLVDAGMVAQLSDDESSTFIGLLSCLGTGNGRAAAAFVLQFSLENEMSPEREQEFAADMQALFEERCRGYGTNVAVGDVLRGVLGLVRKYQVRVDANFATLVVNVLCLESIARGCLPEYNVLDAARPLLETYRKLCYEPDGTPRPQVRRSKWAKLILSLMYARKRFLDRSFFRRAQKERDERNSQW